MNIKMRIVSAALLIMLLFTFSGCKSKKNYTKTDKKETASESVSEKSEKEETEESGNESSDNQENEKNETTVRENNTDKAIHVINEYVSAAKKLDFNTMNKYMYNASVLPILDLDKNTYSKYSISEERIYQLCKARLSTYKITPISASAQGNDVIVTTQVSKVNMESLQNKWMEVLCNKYPEYTSLTSEQMTPEVVDRLIETMIEVLKTAEPTITETKNITVKNSAGTWKIAASNEDFFPSK